MAHIRTLPAALCAWAWWLAATAASAATASSLTPLPLRTSDEVIRRDLQSLSALEARLAGASTKDRWRAARGRALVGAARVEYLENDRTRFDIAAYQEALKMADDIASGAEPAAAGKVPASGILGGSVRVREDLWRDVDSLKQSPGFDCAMEEIARAEVALLWAGNEQVDQGDCNTSPHIANAERELRDAHNKAELCRAQPTAARRDLPRPAPAPAPSAPALVPAMPTAEEVRIPRNTHFALNSFGLSPTSHSVIQGIVNVLLEYPSISARLEGHTDSRGSSDYNLRLSKQRVDAVRDRMVELGVDANRITTAFRGKETLKVAEDSKVNFARNRRVEMVFVDYEGHDIQAEDQEEDLQIETDPAPRPARSPAAPRKP